MSMLCASGADKKTGGGSFPRAGVTDFIRVLLEFAEDQQFGGFVILAALAEGPVGFALGVPAEAEVPPLPDYSDATGRVALTFDDGPSGPNSEVLLAMLAERDVKATFFLCGYRIEECPAELCKKLAEPGHELAMHGYSHTSFKEMSSGGIQDELSKTKELIQKNAGVTPTLVRPPYGAMNDDSYEALRQAGYPVIIWDVDTEDWRNSDPEDVANTVFEQVQDGSIILMHDMHQSSVDAAALIIDQLKSEGYVFLTVSELAQSMGVTLAPGERYRSIEPPEDENAAEESTADESAEE